MGMGMRKGSVLSLAPVCGERWGGGGGSATHEDRYSKVPRWGNAKDSPTCSLFDDSDTETDTVGTVSTPPHPVPPLYLGK